MQKIRDFFLESISSFANNPDKTECYWVEVDVKNPTHIPRPDINI